MITKFESKFIKIAENICDNLLQPPCNEEQIQMILSNSYHFKNNFFVGSEIADYTVEYWPTNIYIKNLKNKSVAVDSFSKLIDRENYFEIKRSWKPHIDILYNELICNNKYLVELKFPHGKNYSWSILDNDNYSFYSPFIFQNVFLEYQGKKYITDEKMGKMIVDFTRLLNIYKSNNFTINDKLYFISFHKKNEHSESNRENFKKNMATLLEEYCNGQQFCITRNEKMVDIWEYQPCSLSYYTKRSDYKEVCFDDKNPSFDLLYEGKELFCFLIRIKTQI